jgi:hypothetical protein
MELVFVQALRAESSVAEGQRLHTGYFLWDLQNYHEALSRPKLWQRSSELGFNLAILAIALNQYGARRFIGLGALTLDCNYALRGIAAGCGLATIFVQIYALPPLRAWRLEHPKVSLTMFIDDLGGVQRQHTSTKWSGG